MSNIFLDSLVEDLGGLAGVLLVVLVAIVITRAFYARSRP